MCYIILKSSRWSSHVFNIFHNFIPYNPVSESSKEDKNQNTEKVVTAVFLTPGQECCYESKEDTMSLNLKITLKTFVMSIKMKACINTTETESSNLEGQITFLKREPGQNDEQYEVDNCKIMSESTFRSLIPFHWTLWRLKRIIVKTTD